MLKDHRTEAGAEVVADNLRAVQAIYFASQLENMGMFQVVERLAQLYQQGLLPLGKGNAAKLLRRHANGGKRLSARERKALYARALGTQGAQGAQGNGADEPQPHREFHTLWLRFVVSVALCAREQKASVRVRTPVAARAAVWRAAQALAAYASAQGAGSLRAVQRLSRDANLLRAVLEDSEIRNAFGARDMWQVVEQVASNELGGAVNVARFRTLAQAGSTILQWLADHAAALNQPVAASKDLPNPDTGLIEAVEQWLACSGVHDAAITQAAVTHDAMPTGVATVTGATVDLLAIAHELMRIIGLRPAPVSDDPVRTTDEPVRRSGPIALFCGGAGSGKTLGAHALATALSRDLVRVDLKQTVSKYIGETEKNLDAVFSRAESLGALLLLDEADALFGRRTDVHDSHDRYANVQAQALLRRLRAYPGVVIVESKVTPASSDQDWTTGLTRVVSFPLPFPSARRLT